jgi:hypothetical protein
VPPAAAAALRAAMRQQRMQETLANREPATAARPPREMPVVMVKPPNCWAGVLDKGSYVLLSRGHSRVQLEVDRRTGSLHGQHVLHLRVRLYSLTDEEGVHLSRL